MDQAIHQANPGPGPQLDLVFERVVDISPTLICAAWTTEEHIKHWFTPTPRLAVATPDGLSGRLGQGPRSARGLHESPVAFGSREPAMKSGVGTITPGIGDLEQALRS